MKNKEMETRLVNILAALVIGIVVVILYTIVHESAHALFVVIFGGKVLSLDFNVLSGYPHINWEGNMKPYENAVISIAGPLVPYLLLITGLTHINRNRHLLIQKIFLFISVIVLGSMIPNIIIPILLEVGVDVTGEDTAKFAMSMNLNGYVVAFIMAILFVLAAILIIKRLRIKEALAYSIHIEVYNKKTSILTATLILIFIGALAAISFNVISKNMNAYHTSIPKEYDNVIDIDMKNMDKTESEIYELTVEESALYDFNIVGNTSEDVQLKLVGSSRINGLRTNEMVISLGKGKVNASYTNWFLEKGSYNFYLTKAESKGKIKMYINSKIPDDSIFNLIKQEEAILNGDIPQQEFKLAAKTELSDYSNKMIYEFTLEQDKNVAFSIFLTTGKGRAIVELIGENYKDVLISEYQIKTEGRGSFLKKGTYHVVVSCSDCDGDIYFFSQE